MDSNHELDRLFNHRNLLILKSHKSHQKPQEQGLGTKSVQNFLSPLDDVHREIGFHVFLTVAAVVADSPFLEINIVSDDARAP